MRTRSVKHDEMDCILMALNRTNRLVCKLMLKTGLRVGDILALKTSDLEKERFTIKQQKTGKPRRLSIATVLKQELKSQAGRFYVFEHRTDQYKHRTRQAVYLDIKRAAKGLGLKGVVSPHSVRKTYAVERYNACGDMERVQKLLNHKYIGTTMLYVYADELRKRNGRKNKKHVPPDGGT